MNQRESQVMHLFKHPDEHVTLDEHGLPVFDKTKKNYNTEEIQAVEAIADHIRESSGFPVSANLQEKRDKEKAVADGVAAQKAAEEAAALAVHKTQEPTVVP